MNQIAKQMRKIVLSMSASPNRSMKEAQLHFKLRHYLTVAHLDHTPENCADDNLKALCQRCHNRYDMPMRRAGIRERARAAMACADLFSPTETEKPHLSPPNGGDG